MKRLDAHIALPQAHVGEAMTWPPGRTQPPTPFVDRQVSPNYASRTDRPLHDWSVAPPTEVSERLTTPFFEQLSGASLRPCCRRERDHLDLTSVARRARTPGAAEA